MIPLLQKRWPPAAEVRIGGETVTVTVKVSARARSYRLSLPHAGTPLLTVPKFGRWGEAKAFLDRHTDWLAERLEDSVKPVAFVRGAVVPLRGVNHRIVPTGKVRGTVAVGEHDGEMALLVPGAPEHRARRLTDWLKAQAEHDLAKRCAVHGGNLGVIVKSISMRSQATRWGSCSSTGKLNFNWRLILAPPYVLDYVAAHEVAHLLEMNHSQDFWDVVERTLPSMERGREWLRIHGRELMGYGIE
ncbi:MAG: M48 family peptidase [Hyphomicrobiales bacterium]|nr:MAG: M48 family peptidase [Hyphomicrobiales bacterium]